VRASSAAAVGALSSGAWRSGAPSQADALRVLMLTGDSPNAAARIGRQLGIADVAAGLSPAQKLAAVQAARRRGVPSSRGPGVIMVSPSGNTLTVWPWLLFLVLECIRQSGIASGHRATWLVPKQLFLAAVAVLLKPLAACTCNVHLTFKFFKHGAWMALDEAQQILQGATMRPLEPLHIALAVSASCPLK
jgi:magnesium-transporting ATPase (P-type)